MYLRKLELLFKAELAAFIKDCANSKSKGNRYTTDALVVLLTTLEHHDIPEYAPEEKMGDRFTHEDNRD